MVSCIIIHFILQCNNSRNKVHSKCNVLESFRNLPPAPPHPGPWKNCLPWNWSLVPKSSGTAGVENKFTPRKHSEPFPLVMWLPFWGFPVGGQCNWQVPWVAGSISPGHSQGFQSTQRFLSSLLGPQLLIYLWLSFPGNKLWDGALCAETYWECSWVQLLCTGGGKIAQRGGLNCKAAIKKASADPMRRVSN